jgi:hypothetical protein
MVTTTRFRRGGWMALAAAPLLLGAGALHAHGMMGMGMMGGRGDTQVTKEQFMQRAEQRFARMDANDDGVLDASDRAAMRKRMRDCMGMMHGDGMGAMGGGTQGGAAAPKQDHESHHPQP